MSCFTFRSRLAPRNACTCLWNGAAACLADFVAAFIASIAFAWWRLRGQKSQQTVWSRKLEVLESLSLTTHNFRVHMQGSQRACVPAVCVHLCMPVRACVPVRSCPACVRACGFHWAACSANTRNAMCVCGRVRVLLWCVWVCVAVVVFFFLVCMAQPTIGKN